MDLNIGNAFFFASRGKGYLQEHTEEEVAKAYEAAIDDRPLLRIGEEGALKAVGLATQGEGLEESREKFYQTQSKDMSEIDLKPPCIIPLCKRVGKLGCPRRLCKRCCDRAYREEQVAITNDPTRVYVNNCPVHKTKQKQIKAMNAKRGIVATVEDEEEKSDNDTSIEHKVPNSSIGSNGDEESSSSNVKVHEISSAPKISYQSKCKILLVGLGADEQLAGYGRHRTCFAKGGWEALCQELNMDLTRLWQRNLGRYDEKLKNDFYYLHLNLFILNNRDDRCISDNGREGWFPFLDEDFVSFVQATPINIVS